MKVLLSQLMILAVALGGGTCVYGQDGMNITLRADYSPQKKVYHDEPVILTVTVANNSIRSDLFWNLAIDRRIKAMEVELGSGKLSKEDADMERASLEKNRRTSQPVIIGGPADPWRKKLQWKFSSKQSGKQIPVQVSLLQNPEIENELRLDGPGSVTGYFGLSGEAMQMLQAGDYIVSVLLNNISSDEVLLQVRGENMTVAIRNSDSMLLKTGQYFWHANDSKNAGEYGDRLIRKDTASIEGWVLKGDAYFLDQNYQKALESYRQALKSYYLQNSKSSEPPDYLLAMISAVQEKLGERF